MLAHVLPPILGLLQAHDRLLYSLMSFSKQTCFFELTYQNPPNNIIFRVQSKSIDSVLLWNV